MCYQFLRERRVLHLNQIKVILKEEILLMQQQRVSTHKPSYTIKNKIENKTKRYIHNIKINMYSQNKVIMINKL